MRVDRRRTTAKPAAAAGGLQPLAPGKTAYGTTGNDWSSGPSSTGDVAAVVEWSVWKIFADCYTRLFDTGDAHSVQLEGYWLSGGNGFGMALSVNGSQKSATTYSLNPPLSIWTWVERDATGFITARVYTVDPVLNPLAVAVATLTYQLAGADLTNLGTSVVLHMASQTLDSNAVQAYYTLLHQ